MGLVTSLAKTLGAALSPDRLVAQLKSLKLPDAPQMSLSMLPKGGTVAGAVGVVMRGVGSATMFTAASAGNGVLQTVLPPCYMAAVSSPLFRHKKGAGGVDKVSAGIIT